MRISLLLFLFIQLLCLCSWSQQISDLGIFDATAIFHSEEIISSNAGGDVSIVKSEDGFIYNISGWGKDTVDHRTDDGLYLYAKKKGSREFSARFQFVDTDSVEYKFGLMVRENPESNSSRYFGHFVQKKENNQLRHIVQCRFNNNEKRDLINHPFPSKLLNYASDYTDGIYLRILRYTSSNYMECYISNDGLNWEYAWTSGMSLNGDVGFGIFMNNDSKNTKPFEIKVSKVKFAYPPPHALRLFREHTFVPNNFVNVFIKVFNPNPFDHDMCIQERIPQEWSPLEISHNGIVRDSTISWSKTFKPGDTLLSYNMLAPSNPKRWITFRGFLNEEEIGGEYRILKSWLSLDELIPFTRFGDVCSAFPFLLFIVHFFLYLFNKKKSENLYWALGLLLISIVTFCNFESVNCDLEKEIYFTFTCVWAWYLIMFFVLLFSYSILNVSTPKVFWGLVIYGCFYRIVDIFIYYCYSYLFWNPPLFMIVLDHFFKIAVAIELFRMTRLAIVKKVEGIVFLLLAAFVFSIPLFIVSLDCYFGFLERYTYWTYQYFHYSFFMLGFLFLSMFLAYRYAKTRTNLESLNENLELRVIQRTEQLKATQDKLIQSEKMASLGQLVAGVAHEINNPITFIKSNIEPLKSYLEGYKRLFVALGKNVDTMSAELRNDYTTIHKEEDLAFAQEDSERLLKSFEDGSNRISKIVNDLRQYIQVDANYQSLYDIHEAIDSCVDLLQSRMDDRIIVHKSFGDIPSITCSPGQINQVFMNILSNAVDAIKEKGNIWISTQREANNVVIQIRDDGKGIPEDIKTKIYDPFFTTKLVGQGTGLGLSIAHSIVEQHRGDITVESEMGIGTKFNLILPINNQTE